MRELIAKPACGDPARIAVRRALSDSAVPQSGTRFRLLALKVMAHKQASRRQAPRRGPRAADGAGSLPRAARILSHLAGHRGNLSIREMSEQLGIPKTTLHRVLQSLVVLDLLEMQGDGLYTWGPELRRISGAVLQSRELNRLALPVLQEITQRFNETTLLSVYDPKTFGLIFVEQAPGSQPIRYHPTMNIPRPINAGASGRSVMAFLPPKEIERIIAAGLRSMTDHTVVDPKKLRAVLKTVHEKGYAISRGERTLGAVGIGCPILNADGFAIGGIMMTIPQYRFRRGIEKPVVAALKDGAARIARQIGF